MKVVEFPSLEWLFCLGYFCVVFPEGGGRSKERQPEIQFSPSQHSGSSICNIQRSVTEIISLRDAYKKKKNASSLLLISNV